MRANLKLSSVQLMISFFVFSSAVIILQNFYAASDTSFLMNLICVVLGVLIAFLFFVPSIIIRSQTKLDFMSFAHLKTPNAIIFTSAFYAMYFVYAAGYFLVTYTEMFNQKLNPEGNIYVIAFLLLSACVYAVYKGINAITRCGIFIFAFSLLAFTLIFSGNIANLDFVNYSFTFNGSNSDFINNLSYFLTISVIAVIFACVSGKTKNFKIRHIVITMAATVVLFALAMFFVFFVLGDYGRQQSFQFFTLSKSAKFGTMNGMDSLYLSLSTSSVFLIISIITVCINKATGKIKNIKMALIFSLLIFILFICARNFNSVKEILINVHILNILTFVAAVLIPSIYLLFFRRRVNE